MIFPNDWKIIGRSNVIRFDDMGYPLRLFLVEKRVKGIFGKTKIEYTQEWIDVGNFNEDKDVVCEWEVSND